MTELKPCPFCGGKRPYAIVPMALYCYVKCKDCGARGPNETSDITAQEIWNQRKEPTP